MRTLVLTVVLWLVAGVAWAQNWCIVRTPSLAGTYSGECSAGLAHGRGSAQGTDRYEGQFREGQPHGQGVYTFADGRRFEGEFSAGRVNGRARFTFANGEVLDGEFRDNLLAGVGRLYRAAGEILLVEWRGNALATVAVQQAAAAPATALGTPGNPASPSGAGGTSWAGSSPAAATVPTSGGTSGGSGEVRPAAGQWIPRLDFEDIFPAYVLAASTRKAPSEASRSVAAARGDPLATLGDGERLRGDPAPPVAPRARYLAANTGATYLGDPWGLLGIRIMSPAAGTRVAVQIEVDGLSEPTTAEFVLPSTGDHALYPSMRWRFDRLRSQTQPTPTNVIWRVSVDGGPVQAINRVVQVRSVQDAPLAIVTPRGAENLTWVFAAFVTEDAPWIDEVIRSAFAGQRVGAVGYQVGEAEVMQQVAIVYQHLRSRGFRYSSITTNSSGNQRVWSQAVRFPSDSMRTVQANCVDGTVLMASILRRIGIEPIIVLGPGHAMLGFYPQQDPRQGFVVVETTALESADFDVAVRKGMGLYRKWAAEAADHPQFRRIPVRVARDAGVMPIAR
jgi:hypothetical protein